MYLKTALDYEDRMTYDLVVMARDGSSDSNDVEVTVSIKVEDVNDNTPRVIVNTLTSSKQARIQEKSDIGKFAYYYILFTQDMTKSSSNINVNSNYTFIALTRFQ